MHRSPAREFSNTALNSQLQQTETHWGEATRSLPTQTDILHQINPPHPSLSRKQPLHWDCPLQQHFSPGPNKAPYKIGPSEQKQHWLYIVQNVY